MNPDGCGSQKQASKADAYLDPPRLAGPPDDSHAVNTRAFQGIPSLAVSPTGGLWATWYAGCTPAEDHNNYVVLAFSSDGGHSWEEILAVDPDGEGPVRAFDPELWLAPDGRLWFFWAQHPADNRFAGSKSGVWSMTAGIDNGRCPRWSEPRRLCDGVMMCKPLALSSGEWALPVSFWHRREAASAGVVVSNDQGSTWVERGACDVPPDVRNHDEHMLVELSDGALWMLVRTGYGIGESISRDGGKSWQPLQPSAIRHVASRFFVRRLQSGNLLLVKHGPINERTERSCLTAYLSEDEGRTWSGGLMLDERKRVSYPDGQQAADGTIHIVYDYSRTGDREILMAKFRERDVVAADANSPTVCLRMTVSRVIDE